MTVARIYLHVGGGNDEKCLHSESVLRVEQVGLAGSLDVGIRERGARDDFLNSKLAEEWICYLLRWLRLVDKEWKSRYREEAEEFIWNKLGLRCVLELAPGLATPEIRKAVRIGGITLGSSAYGWYLKIRTLTSTALGPLPLM